MVYLQIYMFAFPTGILYTLKNTGDRAVHFDGKQTIVIMPSSPPPSEGMGRAMSFSRLLPPGTSGSIAQLYKMCTSRSTPFVSDVRCIESV